MLETQGCSLDGNVYEAARWVSSTSRASSDFAESFGDKVSWLVTLTSGVAILGVCLLLALIEYANLRGETLASLESQTQLVAMNSSAPLAFSDRYSAEEALAAFRA